MGEQKYRNMGALRLSNTQYGQCGGTGLLVSPNLVLTVAHNVFNRGSREINKIIFYPGQCEELVEANAYEVEDFFFPGAFTTRNSNFYDYALLKLNKPVTGASNFMNLSGAVDKIDQKTTLSICGYPWGSYKREKENGTEKKSLWGVTISGKV